MIQTSPAVLCSTSSHRPATSPVTSDTISVVLVLVVVVVVVVVVVIVVVVVVVVVAAAVVKIPVNVSTCAPSSTSQVSFNPSLV